MNDNAADILEFVHENVASYVTKEDIEQYVEVLETLIRKLDNPSGLFENDNLPSMVAIVAWSFEHDIDLDDWILDYCSRNDSYIDDQTENFRIMREDLEQFIKQVSVA